MLLCQPPLAGIELVPTDESETGFCSGPSVSISTADLSLLVYGPGISFPDSASCPVQGGEGVNYGTGVIITGDNNFTVA